MPELPDVDGFRCVLAEHAVGQRINRVEVHDAAVLRNATPDELANAVVGHAFGEPQRHGKWLLAHTDGPTVLIHFGMTGGLAWCQHDDPRHRHDRVAFVLDNGELRYRDMRKLQGVWLAGNAKEVAGVLADVGPDALAIGREEFAARLCRTHRRIKAVLVDQSVLAGLGNLLADEMLWRARIHPEVPAAELTERQRHTLYEQMRLVLRESVRAGQVLTRSSWLTGARDDPDARCPRCHGPLSRGRVTTGRTTVWCPYCQRH